MARTEDLSVELVARGTGQRLASPAKAKPEKKKDLVRKGRYGRGGISG